jgi:outer membrane protein OmpA-like peptidoglycan-associated protein
MSSIFFATSEESADFGEQILAAAEVAMESDTPPVSSAALLALLLSGVNSSNPSEAENCANPLDPLDAKNPFPSATTLFNTFINPNHPLSSRHALHHHYSRRFQVLAHPGEPIADLSFRPGDLLLRIARGEGWGCVAVVAAPELHRHDHLGAIGLRGESYPRLRPGLYVQVVEIFPRRRRRDDRFARRFCDGSGLVLPDTLLLRPRPAHLWGTENDEAVPDFDILSERPSLLRRGSTGTAVREAQRKLNRIHVDAVALGFPGLAGCPLVEDSRFGERMEAAVRSLQQQVFSDPSEWNGVIDPKTWAQLDLLAGTVLSAARTKFNEAVRSDESFSSAFAFLKQPVITLKTGEKRQFYMDARIDSNWSYSVDGPTGIVNISIEDLDDPPSRRGVVGGFIKKLVSISALAPGQVKVSILAKLGSVAGTMNEEILKITVQGVGNTSSNRKNISSPSPAQIVFPSTLSESSFAGWNTAWEARDVDRNSPDYIRWVQSSLNQIIGSQLVVDGLMGFKTRAAVRSFQQQRGLVADGIVGRQTDQALRVALSGDSSVPPVTPCTTLDHFPQGSDTILPEHQLKLISIVRQILVEHVSNVDITGFTSSEGSDADNLALGQRRAERVARELRATLDLMSPGSSRYLTVRTRSRGESEQIAGGNLELNRRVTICLANPPSVQQETVTLDVEWAADVVDLLPSDVIIRLAGEEVAAQQHSLSSGTRTNGVVALSFDKIPKNKAVTMTALSGNNALQLFRDQVVSNLAEAIVWEHRIEELVPTRDGNAIGGEPVVIGRMPDDLTNGALV